MLLTARTALFIAKSLVACRERLVKQQYLHGNLFVQGNLQEETREINSARDFNSFVALSAIEAAVLLFVMLIRINLLARCMDRFSQLAGLPLESSLHKEVSVQILLLECLSRQALSDLTMKRAMHSVCG